MARDRDILVGRLPRMMRRSDGDSDGTLLGRFLADRDEVAFAALVDRHGPLVLHVCRRILGDPHDAEDAFQATFLVLARRAAAVRPPEALAAWLHSVARRVSLKARTARARRTQSAARPGPPPEARPDPLDDLSARELLALVDDEVQRLPTAYRLPVLLCCLEGRTQDEAARQLGWTPGSVKGRLERGRACLNSRLARRGLTLSAGLAAVEVSRGVGSALMARWASDTARAALAFTSGRVAGAGPSGPATVLAREVVRAMALTDLRLPAALVLATCLIAVGLAAYRPADPLLPQGPRAQLSPPREAPVVSAVQIPTTDEPTGLWPEAATRPLRVSGRVLDPAGGPFAGARLYVGYAARRCDYYLTAPAANGPVRGTTGQDGQFDFAFARSELDPRYLDTSRPVVVAAADGFGLAWAELGEPTALRLQLVEDQPVEGRILDQARRPVAGVLVAVREVSIDLTGGMPAEAPSADRSGVWTCRGPLPGLPSQVTTGADGRFRLTGLGRNRLVVLTVEGPGVRHTGLQVATTAGRPGRGLFLGPTFEYAAYPLRAIRGVVRDRATGRPVAGARVSLETYDPPTFTDTEGRYELHTQHAPTYVVTAQPRGGEPLFAGSVRVAHRPGTDPLTADFDLAGGIPLKGRVTDATTGKPPPRAVAIYYPAFPNSHAAGITGSAWTAPSSAPIRPDGSFGLAVQPGPGVVFVSASPGDLYASAMLDEGEWTRAFGDATRSDEAGTIPVTAGGQLDRRVVGRYAAVALICPDERAESVALDLAVRPAHAVPGTVVGPDGAPVVGVRVIGLTAAKDAETLTAPKFMVEGLHPRGTRELIFHHREKGVGKVVTVRGDRPEPRTVRLDPCGVVTGRVVNKAGNPAPEVTVSLVGGVTAMGVSAKTGGDGRFRVSVVPGLRYALKWNPGQPMEPVVVEVEPGRTRDLGDLFLDR